MTQTLTKYLPGFCRSVSFVQHFGLVIILFFHPGCQASEWRSPVEVSDDEEDCRSSRYTQTCTDSPPWIYAASGDSTLYRINGLKGTQSASYNGHIGPILSVAVGPEGSIITGGADGGLHKLAYKNGAFKVLWKYQGHKGEYQKNEVTALSVDNDGDVYSGGLNGELDKTNGKTGKRAWIYERDSGAINAVTLNSEGNVYFGGTRNLVVKINASKGTKAWEYKVGLHDIEALAIDRDNSVYSGEVKGLLKFRPGSSGRLDWEYEAYDGAVETIEVNESGNIYGGDSANQIHKIEIDDRSDPAWINAEHTGPVHAIVQDSQNALYSCSEDASVQKIDQRDGSQKWLFTKPVESINDLAIEKTKN